MADESVYVFVAVVTIIVGLLLIQWCIAVVKYLIIPNWEKIKEAVTNIFLGVFGILGIIFFVWLFFHDCKGCDNRHHDIDHVHYERF